MHSGDGKTVKTLEESRISTSFQRGIVLTCFAPACIEGEFSIEPFYSGANITRSEPRSASSYGLYSSRGLSLKSTQEESFSFSFTRIEMSLVFVKLPDTKE